MAVKPMLQASDVLAGRVVDFSRKSVIVADLDKTFTESRHQIEDDTAAMMKELLMYRRFVIISGGKYSLIKYQLLDRLEGTPPALLSNLFVFTSTAAMFHRFQDGKWVEVYAERFTPEQRRRIKEAFALALEEVHYEPPEKTYGEVIEDRETQVTFTALGQDSPVELRAAWDPDMKKRPPLRDALIRLLPDFTVAIGGGSSIDVTKKGIDKGYGIHKNMEFLHCGVEDMVFIGDSCFEGGADYPARREGVDSIQVSGREEGKRVLKYIVAELAAGRQ
jgi:phosphomannomutase